VISLMIYVGYRGSDIAGKRPYSTLLANAVCQRTLKKLRTLKKKKNHSKCVKFGTKSTHFEKKSQSAL
jgi:hypothetical protein